VVEAGYPKAQYLFWGGLSVPAKTPRAVIDRLHQEGTKALKLPAVQARLDKLGVQPMPMSAEEFTAFFHKDVAETISLAKDIGIVPTD
jgi:tripartite-type tricarboxylate transporter receptor subunit TctC